MKLKIWAIATISTILMLLVTGCQKDSGPDGQLTTAPTSEFKTKLVVGASSTPHAEILEFVKPILAKQGYALEIIPFNDYVLPNTALAADELDANFFQHIPYLEKAIKNNAGDKNYDFVNAGEVFITPLGLYSTKYKSLAELPDKAQIITSSNVAERGRVISIFVKEGFIKVKPGVELTNAEYDDIIENPKNLQFKADVDPALMPQVHKNGEGDIQIINPNFAIVSGLNPVTDPIYVESKANNPYANILVVRQKNINNPAVKALAKAVQLPETKAFMLEKFNGAVVPAP